ncbi:cellulose binding domain-containing protein [Actinoplanes xinjiangensis]|uniref:Cellulose binding domain-containing protein n=2 Tax=Actinoplanes xinjiangensis TaxID=512350 RepID=A0A316FFV4_9ACTN|nr:cellulose binding domain-containing protein [Actinoplanes xinjiangensis]
MVHMRQLSRTTRRSAVAGVLTIGVVIGTGFGGSHATAGAPAAAPAAALPAGSVLDRIPPSVRDRMIAQEKLVDTASVVRTAVTAGAPRGYAGIGLVGDHVTLWWKGALPADIAAAVTAARHIAPVSVQHAAYSGSQLKAQADGLAEVVDADPADAAHGVRIKTDGSGLEVLVDTARGAKIPALPKSVVPVRTVPQKRLEQRSTRLDDVAPWSGGMRLYRDPGYICTSGFGVRDLSTATPYLITAAHCGDLGTEWKDWSGEPVGTTVQRNADHDAEMIAVPSVSNKIYVGGVEDGVQARVAGWTEVYPGQLLCQSGTVSAEATGAPVCNLEVKFHYTDREELVEATQLDGLEAARGGDSGGPVYAVTAAGTVLAAGTTTRTAGAGFGFQDFATYRQDFGDIVPVTEDGTGSCRVSYQVTDAWSTGYTVNVTVYNSGADVNGWHLGWNLPDSGQIQGRWNADVTQTGTAVTATNAAHNATITAGGAVTFGFTASGAPNTPSPITLNGVPCA